MNSGIVAMAGLQIVNLIIIILVLGLGIYIAILSIKALKIYIKKNS